MNFSRRFLVFLSLVSALGMVSAARAASEALEYRTYQSIEGGAQNKAYLDPAQRSSLLQSVSTNPVARIDDDAILQKYDPTGEIGYCYGRAMTAHLTARRMGLASGSIRKLFAIGDMRQSPVSTQPEWRFHVTTLVKGEDGNWWAIDPIMGPPLGDGKPLLAQNWMAIVSREWDKPRPGKHYHLFFYLVESAVILPEIRNLSTSPIMQYATFDPSRVAGFHSLELQGKTVYEVDEQAEPGAFISVNADPPKRFRFLNITIEGRTLDYHGYFVDLLKYLVTLRPDPDPTALFAGARAEFSEPPRPTFTNYRHNLYSPRLGGGGGETNQ